MSKVADDMLMAFVDGELDPAERAHIEAQLSSDPELRERVKVFEATREPIADLFDPLLRRPPRDRLVRLIQEKTANPNEAHEGAPTAAKPSGVIETFVRIFWPAWSRPLAIAFSAVFLIGAGTGWLMNHLANTDRDQIGFLIAFQEGGLLARGGLQHTLESVRSGTTFLQSDAAGQRLSIKPILTFRDLQNRFCREYEIVLPPDSQFSGVACRVKAQTWRVLAHTRTTTRPDPKSSIAPASGGSSRALDAIVERTMAGDALGAEHEAALIKKKWPTD